MKYAFLILFAGLLCAATHGPSHGSLVIIGGGQVGPEIWDRFFTLAGGKDQELIVIPSAGEDNQTGESALSGIRKAGATHVSLLHTRDRAVADSEAFASRLRAAHGVFFSGGRQWRLADAYLGTRTQRELEALLKRGGVIAGSSAGATIIGSFMVRGAVSGNTIMVSPDHIRGMGFLPDAAIDQHLITRHRESDLVSVIDERPKLLGIGLDESTAIVVQQNRFEVIGKSKVAIYTAGKPYYFLKPGDRFDLKKRKPISQP